MLVPAQQALTYACWERASQAHTGYLQGPHPPIAVADHAPPACEPKAGGQCAVHIYPVWLPACAASQHGCGQEDCAPEQKLVPTHVGMPAVVPAAGGLLILELRACRAARSSAAVVCALAWSGADSTSTSTNGSGHASCQQSLLKVRMETGTLCVDIRL